MKRSKVLKLLRILLVASIASSCAGFDHRDYSEVMEGHATQDLTFLPHIDFPVVSGDEGDYGGGIDVIIARTPGYKNEKKVTSHEESLRAELIKLEQGLDESHQSDYLKYRSKFDSDSARIYYLGLREPREKYRYLKTIGLVKETPNQSYSAGDRSIAGLSNDIVFGMNKKDVKRIWGEPVRIDYSGQKNQENERWAYRRDESVKFIYFDGGKVEGWTQQ